MYIFSCLKDCKVRIPDIFYKTEKFYFWAKSQMEDFSFKILNIFFTSLLLPCPPSTIFKNICDSYMTMSKLIKIHTLKMWSFCISIGIKIWRMVIQKWFSMDKIIILAHSFFCPKCIYKPHAIDNKGLCIWMVSWYCYVWSVWSFYFCQTFTKNHFKDFHKQLP